MNLLCKLKENRNKIILETFPFQILLVLFWDLALLSPTTDKSNIAWVIAGTVLLNTFLALSVFFLLRSKCIISMFKEIRKNPYIFLVMGVFVICFTTILNSWLNLDGFLYYTMIRGLKQWNFSWSRLMLAGHMSQGYTIFALIAEFLSPNNAFGVRAMQCAMALITIYCFYLILDTIFNNKNKIDLTIYTAIFSFSPMFLGILGEINVDFPSLCFFVWMVCCGIRRRYISQALCGLLLCFSKETGVLLYGFYAFGMVLFRIVDHRKLGLKEIVKKTVSTDIVLLSFGGIVWILNFFYNKKNIGGWISNIAVSGNNAENAVNSYKLNTFGFCPEYIIQKIMQMLYINFSWILCAIILCSFIVVSLKGSHIYRNEINLKPEHAAGIAFSFIAFLLYSFLYITYTGYRYNIPFAFFVSFWAVLSLAVLFKKSILRRTIGALLILILLGSNFASIDPIAEKLFMTQWTGVDNILIPSTMISDSNNNISIAGKYEYNRLTINGAGVYNFQCHQLGSCFNKTLEHIQYNNKMLIVLPCEYRDAYGSACSLFGARMANYEEYYWDTTSNKLNLDCVQDTDQMQQDSRYQKLNYIFVNSLGEISKKEMKKYDYVYYIALPFDPDYDHKNFMSGSKATLKDTIRYFCWKWDVYEIYPDNE